MSYEEGLFLSKLVLEKLGNRLWLSPLLGVILSAEKYLAQGHSLSEKNPQPMSDQKHGLIISVYSVKNPRRNKGCSENGGTNTITINFIRSTLLCVWGGVDNRAGHCRAMSTVKSLLMSDGSI